MKIFKDLVIIIALSLSLISCDEEKFPTPIPTPTPTPMPTVPPVSGNGLIEAENTNLLGNSTIIEDTNASEGNVVGNLLEAGAGVTFIATQDSRNLRLGYSSLQATTLSIHIDGIHIEEIAIDNTITFENYLTSSVSVNIEEGDIVSITLNEVSSGIQLDFIQQLVHPYQIAETYSLSIAFGDGLAVSQNGDVYVSSGQRGGRVQRIAADKTQSDFATGLLSANGSDVDSNGNLFVAAYLDNSVFKITPEGTRTTFVSGLDGPAGLWIDNADNVYVTLYGANFSATGATVIRITPDQQQSVYASGGGLADVVGIVGDENGDIYVGNNASAELYKVTNGNVRLFSRLQDIVPAATLNMIDYAQNHIYIPHKGRILRVGLDGTAEVFAGEETQGGRNGPIDQARFNGAAVVAFSDNEQEMFILDGNTGRVRRIFIGD